jgi:hypothetical protein
MKNLIKLCSLFIFAWAGLIPVVNAATTNAIAPGQRRWPHAGLDAGGRAVRGHRGPLLFHRTADERDQVLSLEEGKLTLKSSWNHETHPTHERRVRCAKELAFLKGASFKTST